MSLYLGLNRRSADDRRTLDAGGDMERSSDERRSRGSDRYMLVLGGTGMDRFGLLVGFPAALLVAGVVIGTFFVA